MRLVRRRRAPRLRQGSGILGEVRLRVGTATSAPVPATCSRRTWAEPLRPWWGSVIPDGNVADDASAAAIGAALPESGVGASGGRITRIV
jgi:hypothetical protein